MDIDNKWRKNIDTFQRNLLREIVNVKWSRKITNEELYKKTREIMWSTKIKHRRLIWYGHAQRLPNQAQEINLVWTCSTTTKRHSLQVVELSQHTRTAVQIVSNPPAPSNGGPIYRFLGMPAMRTRWTAGAAAHKSG